VSCSQGCWISIAPTHPHHEQAPAPLHDRPMVTYAIEALVQAGIRELMLVTGGAHAGDFLDCSATDMSTVLTGSCRSAKAGSRRHLALRPVRRRRPCCRHAGRQPLRKLDREHSRQLRTPGAGARILLAPIDDAVHLRQLGVADLEGAQVLGIVEKPDNPQVPTP